MRSLATVFALSLLLVSMGCSQGMPTSESSRSISGKRVARAPSTKALEMPASEEAGASGAMPDQAESQPPSDSDADATPSPVQRQIIYTARLQLIVDDFDGVPEQVEKLAAQHGGFVSNSNLQGRSGSPRHGEWTIRVPVQKYGVFLESAKSLGEFQSLATESEEVTAEFYDVLARIENKQRQEKRLIELLEKATGKLSEVLQVEEQLARVREEIERMQGRMRVLRDLTAFSTITLSIQEIQGYQPPAAPTFGSRIARAWNGTISAMIDAAQNLVIGLVAVGPWLVVLIAPVLLVVFLFRRRTRHRD